MDIVTLQAARAAAKRDGNVAYQQKRTYDSANVFSPLNIVYSGSAVRAVGASSAGVMYFTDGALLRRGVGGGTLTSVGVPANTSAATCSQVYEWNGYAYAIFQDTTDSIYKVFRAPITTGTTPLAWSSPLASLSSGATGYACTITGTATALLVGEYGDPVNAGTPAARLLRSTDGTTFTVARTLASTFRHIHCVAADPFNPGQVWMSFGDNAPNCYAVSTDHGATFTDVTCPAIWQGVQISFTKDWVFVAPDAISSASVFVFDRATKKPRVASFGDHKSQSIQNTGTQTHGVTTSGSTTFATGVPDYSGAFTAADKGRKIFGPGIPDGTTIAAVNAANNVTLSANATATATGVTFTIDRSERPKSLCFLGVVDPATGIYYGVANSELSTAVATTYARNVLFMVPYVGGPVIYLGAFNVTPPAIVLDSTGLLYVSNVSRQLIQAPYAA